MITLIMMATDIVMFLEDVLIAAMEASQEILDVHQNQTMMNMIQHVRHQQKFVTE